MNLKIIHVAVEMETIRLDISNVELMEMDYASLPPSLTLELVIDKESDDFAVVSHDDFVPLAVIEGHV